MKLVLADATYLKDSIGVISELVNEARLKVTQDGVEMVAMDPANVAMVIFKLLSSAFSEYQIEKNQEIGLNLGQLKQILKRVKPSDALTLEVTEDNHLKVTMRADTVRTFSLPIIDLEEREQRIPNLTFPVMVETTSGTLSDAMEDAGIVAEAVTLAVEPERLLIAAEGDLSKAHVEVGASDATSIKTDTKAQVKAKYSLEYLKKMIAGGKLADRVSVCFNQDYPLRLEYKVVDKLLLAFILAPRVETD